MKTIEVPEGYNYAIYKHKLGFDYVSALRNQLEQMTAHRDSWRLFAISYLHNEIPITASDGTKLWPEERLEWETDQ